MLRRIRKSSTVALVASPVGLLLLAATRVLIVSGYNLETALAVVSSSGYINTLIGSVIPLVPVLMPYIALLLLYLDRVVVALLVLAAAALISPLSMPRTAALSIARQDWNLVASAAGGLAPLLLLLGVPLALLLVIEITGFRIATVARTMGTAGIILVLPLMVRFYPIPVSNGFYANILSQPWLPAEALTLTSHQVVSGYVLESDQDWTEVLLAQDRMVVHYRTDDVMARALCQTGAQQSRGPLVPLVPQEPALPTCPQPPTPSGTANPRTIIGTSPVPIQKPRGRG